MSHFIVRAQIGGVPIEYSFFDKQTMLSYLDLADVTLKYKKIDFSYNIDEHNFEFNITH
jgi:hypothetical protein